jgi:hydrogenase-4 component A
MNRFVIADPRRCIGCFACQAACVENHQKAGLQAYPRLYVTISEEGTMPIQCRHCDDAPCAAVCPVNAISCQDHSIQLNESLCIGCKLCALVCPFGVIFLGGTPIPNLDFYVGHYSYVNSPYQAEKMHLREPDIHNFLPAFSAYPGEKTIAVKCDLCYFSEEGPSCIQACPHKALSLVEADLIENTELVLKMKNVMSVPDGNQ